MFTLSAFAQSPQGVRNFHEVDEHVYRGGQPTDEGFRYLSKIGVKTVVDLRASGSRSAAEQRLVTGLGMRYVSVPMSGLTAPTTAESVKILGLLEDTTTGPVFVHCKRGSDRTGAVIGAYRIDHDHWDNARALEEAKSLGMRFFQIPRANYIRTFQARTLEASASNSSEAKAASATPAAAVTAAVQ